MTVKIFGFGWVGRAMKDLFPSATIQDPAQNLFATETADVGFVCVPTPNVGAKWGAYDASSASKESEGALDTSIVEEVVRDASEPLLVIRSTVNPGTCDYLSKKYNKRLVFSPEYLGETPNHPMSDQKARPFVVLGGKPEDVRKVIELYTTVYNANTKITQLTAYEAEVVKLSENRAISFKVAQCQELYDVCEKAGIDYYKIREAVYGDDYRFNMFWTMIYPGKRGMLSKCIPKDVFAWCSWAESLGYQPELTRAILERNKKWLTLNSQ